MESHKREFRKTQPVIFGSLVFFGTLLLAIVTILGFTALYFEYICQVGSGSWAILNGPAFLYISFLELVVGCGLVTYCALNFKPRYAVICLIVGLALYSLSFYLFMSNQNFC